MVKIFVPDRLLAGWFIKSLLPSITKDVAKGGVITEDKFISHAQYLDLIYTQSGTLYEKILMRHDLISIFLLKQMTLMLEMA